MQTNTKFKLTDLLYFKRVNLFKREHRLSKLSKPDPIYRHLAVKEDRQEAERLRCSLELFGTKFALIRVRANGYEGGKNMKQKKYSPILVFALVLLVSQFLYSQSNYQYIHSPEDDVYFGYITYTEVERDGKDPVVIREGIEAPQVAVLNFPLLPGDVIRTSSSRRCEIQLDTGTIIRLDLNTELKIETIMAKSLSTSRKITNFLLNRGEIFIMYKRYNYPEIFQVITPNASAKLKHKTVAMIAAREDGNAVIQVKKGKASVLYGPDEDHLREEVVKKSEKLTVTRKHQALQGEYAPNVDFELWNESINRNFEELHSGLAVVPKPILRYSRAVVYFAQKYSDLYGEWVWDSLYGYVWRPYSNDLYPAGSWRPYYYGQWREVNGQLFWVPMETWGWVPYHLGVWIWNKNRGWLWLPGSAFSPAWVAWGNHMGYCFWRPWTMWDWYFYYWDFYVLYTDYGSSYLCGPFDDPSNLPTVEGRDVLRRLSKNMLQKKPPAYYPLQKEYIGTLKKLVSAMKSGDQGIQASVREHGKQTVFVKKEDLNAARIHEKSVAFRDLSQQMWKNSKPKKSLKDPYREAVKTHRKNAAGLSSSSPGSLDPAGRKIRGTSLPGNAAHSNASKKEDPAKDPGVKMYVDFLSGDINYVPTNVRITRKSSIRSKPFVRFRDWNPDVTVALRAGVSLKYSSRSNEIQCPELNLSSRSVRRVRNLSTITGISASGGGSHSSFKESSSSSSSSRSSGSSRSTSVRSVASSSGGGSRSSKVEKK